MGNLKNYSEKTFEEIKHLTDEGMEFWYARELQKVLEYSEWRNFNKVLDKAKTACENSDNTVVDHFVDVNKTIDMPKGAKKKIDDIMLSRYACYLIVQNGDPRKEVIALGQTYFAVKTRQQEIIENYDELNEEQKRLAIRKEMINHNKSLAEAADNAGVKTSMEYAVFQNHGYMGLYGGLKAKDIHKKKGLKKSQQILDYMGSTELAANLFRATQTDEKLRRENIKGKAKANKTHYEVGKKVRETIEDLGGTMPEDLPTPKKSVKKIEKEAEKRKKLVGDEE
jgi:DNA-damage-inducible protein D